MNCIRCNKEVEAVLEQEKLCKQCFLENIENRVRKTLKQFYLTKGNKIMILNDGTIEAVVTDYVFRKITAQIPLIIETKNKTDVNLETEQKKYTAIVVPWDLDDETSSFIDTMINNKQLEQTKTIKLLQNIYDTEIRIYADLNNFTYTEHEKTKIHKALEAMEKGHPGIEIAMLNTIKKFKEQKTT
ncbi:hypothetical protein HY484_00745 [Candidatus Woesearchaeota archaeon]|nr:hypothetical protein [Candidatus Woesearchaeota archaeon]